MGIGEELQRLATLHQDGHLSDDEFAAAKARLLADGPGRRPADDPRPATRADTPTSRPQVAEPRTSGPTSKFAAWALVAAGLFGILFVVGSSGAPSWCDSLQEFVRADVAALAREGTECLVRAEGYRAIMALLGAGVVALAVTTFVVHRRERAYWNVTSGAAVAAAVAVAIGAVSLFWMIGAGNEAVYAGYDPGADYADSEGGGSGPGYQAPRQETWQERRQRDAIECEAAGSDYRFVIDTGQCIYDPF